MTRIYQAFFIVALAAIFTVRASAAEPAKTPAPETGWATRTLYTPSVPDGDILGDLLTSAETRHADILGLAADEVDGIVGGEVNEMGTPHKSGRIKLSVSPYKNPKAKQRANEFLDAVTSTLAESLRSWNAEQVGFERIERRLDLAQNKWKADRDRLAQFEADIRQQTGRVDASLDAIRAAARKLEDERQSLKLEIVGKRARQKALTETIERLAKTATERTKDDAVAAELEKIIKAREARVESLKQLEKTRGVSSVEIMAAEATVAEARARFLERRETVAQTTGGELLSSLNKDLSTLSIDVAEAEAKLAAVEELRDKYGAVSGLLIQTEDALRDRSRLDADLQAAQEAYRQAEARIPSNVLRVLHSDSMRPDDPRLKTLTTKP